MTGPVGARLPRAAARRLVAGQGRYTDDETRPGLLHGAFLRSPVAHGRIVSLDVSAAAGRPGVFRVLTGAELAGVCAAVRTELAHVPAHVSPEQPLLALDRVRWPGEPVVLVLARTRAQAEDALEFIDLDIEELPAVSSLAAALAADAPLANGTGNVALRMPLDGAWPGGAAPDGATLTQTFRFPRVTGVSLETRSIIAEYNPGDNSLRVTQPQQSPHLAQSVYARLFDIPEHSVRVVAPDVGGAFGLKMHIYPDERAIIAASKLLGRPVKYTADRQESLLADAHTREAEIDASLTLSESGAPAHLDVRVRSAIGAYSIFPRGSLGDPVQALTMAGAAYRLSRVTGEAMAVYQNKSPTGPVRGVGMPMACAVTEVMMDHAARASGEDPADYRRRHYFRDDDFPLTTPGGMQCDRLSLAACHDKILERMGYRALREEQAALRAKGIHRGIGLAAFVEQTAIGAGLYGPAGLPITAQDTATVRLEASGAIRVEVGCTDQGQGTLTGIAQIVAAAMGVRTEDVAVRDGDSAGPFGGGAWGSRGLAISGEAAHLAAQTLRAEVLRLSGLVLQAAPDSLHIADGQVRDASGARLSLAEIARIAHFRQHELPPGVQPQLTASHAFLPREMPYMMSNGIQASYLEIDTETGGISLLGHWVVEDCGRVINPLLVDEQVRGGVVHGLGNALFEECLYDEANGQMLTGTLADYLVPMAAELPDIDVAHVETPQPGTALGAKGAGEAGTVGAIGAVWCAVNDALAPFGAVATQAPFTPARIHDALAAHRNG